MKILGLLRSSCTSPRAPSDTVDLGTAVRASLLGVEQYWFILSTGYHSMHGLSNTSAEVLHTRRNSCIERDIGVTTVTVNVPQGGLKQILRSKP